MKDAVHMAAQLGRLDLVSALLACIGIAIVLAGIFSFIHFRRTAQTAARDEARKIAERETVTYLQNELPGLMEAYRELAENAVRTEQADEIARAQEDDGADNDDS